MASILLFHQGHLLQTCQCSELIRLSFTGTNFAGPPVYISYPYAVQCTTLDFSQNLESTNRYCMRRNFNVKSSTVKRLKKSRACVITFYKKYTNSCQNYSVFILTGEETNFFFFRCSKTKRRSKNWAFCTFSQ